jgi:hypothetical protein
MLLVPLTRRLCSGSILLELTSRAKLCVKAPGFFAYPGGKESAKNSFAMVSSILGPPFPQLQSSQQNRKQESLSPQRYRSQ